MACASDSRRPISACSRAPGPPSSSEETPTPIESLPATCPGSLCGVAQRERRSGHARLVPHAPGCCDSLASGGPFRGNVKRQWGPYPNGQNNLVVEPRTKFPKTRRRCGGFRSITSSKRSNASSRNVRPESGGVPRRGACKTPAGLISSDRSESTDLNFSTKV